MALDTGIPVYHGAGCAVMGDARNVIQQALIGGAYGLVDGKGINVGPRLAAELVETYVWPARPAAEAHLLAWSILRAAIFGDIKQAA